MLNYNHYFTNEEIETIITGWVKEYPQMVKLETIGKSYQGRPIWALTLTNQENGPDMENQLFTSMPISMRRSWLAQPRRCGWQNAC